MFQKNYNKYKIKIIYNFRDVAQPGSALHWGCSGRRFKSGHPDQYNKRYHLLSNYVFHPIYSKKKCFFVLKSAFLKYNHLSKMT